MKKYILLFVSIVITMAACMNEKGPLPKKVVSACDTTVHYSTVIAPIITAKCATSHCHNASATGAPDNFTTYTGLSARVADGTVNTYAVQYITDPMPASGPLSDADKSKIDCWIKQGYPNN